MKKHTFLGTIMPRGQKITLDKPHQITYTNALDNKEFKLILNVNEDIIKIECYSNDSEDETIAALSYLASQAAEGIAGIISLQRGVHFTPHLELFFQDGSESPSYILNGLPELAQIFTDMQLSNKQSEIITELFKDPRLIYAVSDLASSNTSFQNSNVSCARAIEGIRNIITPTPDRRLSWQTMRDELNISKNYLHLITNSSKNRRHGDKLDTSYITTTEVKRRSWIIMCRFLRYKIGGSERLSQVEFPLLDDSMPEEQQQPG